MDVAIPADTHGARVGLIVTKDTSGGSYSVLFDDLNLTTLSTPAPSVVVTSTAAALVARTGESVSTTFTLTNVGDGSSTVSLSTGGHSGFFTQTPGSFTLAPGASQVVTVQSIPQSTSRSFSGYSAVSGSGVPSGLNIPVELLVVAPTDVATTAARAVTTRVDVAAPAGTDPSGSITLVNDSAARGILASDVPWIVPQAGDIVLAAGVPLSATFHVDRSKQPDASSPAGSLSGTIFFVYVRSQSPAKTLADATPVTTSLAVPVTDTRQPQTQNAAVPPLTPGIVSLVIPGVGHVTGSLGKEFISDASILNAKSLFTVSDLKLYYATSSAWVSANQPLGDSQAVQLSVRSTPTSIRAPHRRGRCTSARRKRRRSR